MSFFSTLKNYAHTFTAWVAKEYTKLYAAEPTIAAVADSVFKYTIPALQILVGMEAGAPAANVVGTIAAEAQSSLHAASALIYDFGPSPTVTSIVKGVQDNIGTLLTAGHVTNPASVDAANKIVNSLAALVSTLPPTSGAMADLKPAA